MINLIKKFVSSFPKTFRIIFFALIFLIFSGTTCGPSFCDPATEPRPPLPPLPPPPDDCLIGATLSSGTPPRALRECLGELELDWGYSQYVHRLKFTTDDTGKEIWLGLGGYVLTPEEIVVWDFTYSYEFPDLTIYRYCGDTLHFIAEKDKWEIMLLYNGREHKYGRYYD